MWVATFATQGNVNESVLSGSACTVQCPKVADGARAGQIAKVLNKRRLDDVARLVAELSWTARWDAVALLQK